MQLDHFCEAWVCLGEAVKRFVYLQHVDIAIRGRHELEGLEILERPSRSAAALVPEPHFCVVDEDPAHLPGRDRKKMRPVLPGDVHLDKLDERLMDDGRRLKSVIGALAAHVAPRPIAQLFIYERRQPLEGMSIP